MWITFLLSFHPHEAMIGTDPSSNGLLAEVPGVFLSCKEVCAQPPVSSHYHQPTDVTDMTLGASDDWLEIGTGAGDTATLA